MSTRQPTIHGSAPSVRKSPDERAQAISAVLAMMRGDRRDYDVMLSLVRARPEGLIREVK